jgi:hypothetical protein
LNKASGAIRRKWGSQTQVGEKRGGSRPGTHAVITDRAEVGPGSHDLDVPRN